MHHLYSCSYYIVFWLQLDRTCCVAIKFCTVICKAMEQIKGVSKFFTKVLQKPKKIKINIKEIYKAITLNEGGRKS